MLIMRLTIGVAEMERVQAQLHQPSIRQCENNASCRNDECTHYRHSDTKVQSTTYTCFCACAAVCKPVTRVGKCAVRTCTNRNSAAATHAKPSKHALVRRPPHTKTDTGHFVTMESIVAIKFCGISKKKPWQSWPTMTAQQKLHPRTMKDKTVWTWNQHLRLAQNVQIRQGLEQRTRNHIAAFSRQLQTSNQTP